MEEEGEQDLSSLISQQESLSRELESLKQQEEALLTELDSLILEQETIDSEHAKLVQESVSLNRIIIDSDESIDSVLRKTQYCSSSLRKLKRFNLLNEAMFIHTVSDSLSEPGIKFASINGLRLGRSKDDPVPWTEINAGLGFLCLLIDVIVKKLEINLTQYRLLPRGSYSVIIKKSDRSTLELYADQTSGGLTRFLTGRKFDSAMHALLQIISEIVWHIQKIDKKISTPFPINDIEGKIDGVSVSLQFNSETNWSNAMKMVLANVKRIMGFVEAGRPPS